MFFFNFFLYILISFSVQVLSFFSSWIVIQFLTYLYCLPSIFSVILIFSSENQLLSYLHLPLILLITINHTSLPCNNKHHTILSKIYFFCCFTILDNIFHTTFPRILLLRPLQHSFVLLIFFKRCHPVLSTVTKIVRTDYLFVEYYFLVCQYSITIFNFVIVSFVFLAHYY